MTSTQASLLLHEIGIVAASALVTLGGVLGGLRKVKRTAGDVKDFAEGAVSAVR
jgi:hypothetical protein